ncbi:MAG: aminoacetone oxidase family FAD-binding enzyme [Helicobacter sp.]|uniref:aminoacetone oxidase family FAD-binding enzyme n=1 Tax=Helicobacter sp. TaxID=218 RepID=UPI002A82DF19|nr:aminoacetone oxidase family FAD-binding enzyme [Helicobacter sp.]MDY4426637.1 aminoacetone oxidase family FAD-binding enzyme [Helicobacter sp.]
MQLAPLKIPIYLFDKNKIIGKKLLATGNGHCNIHNQSLSPSCYQSSSFSPKEIHTILKNFDFNAFKRFCEKIGLFLEIKENGKAYPISSSAKSVLEIFMPLLESVTLKLEEEILSISQTADTYCLQSPKDTYTFTHVILACGSEAMPKLGGSDKGLKLVKSLNLEILPTYPSLVPLKINSPKLQNLSGIKLKANITLMEANKSIYQTYDDLLFTSYGISGFGVLDTSSYLYQAKNPKILLDLLPAFSAKSLENIFLNLIKSYPNKNATEILSGLLHPKLALHLVKNLKLQLTNTKTIKQTLYALKNLTLDSPSLYGFDSAEVSGGGVSAREINTTSFECQKFKNLYIIGEMLDIVGNRGGYNLAFTWASAWNCAKAIQSTLKT